ncbi:ABC transporter permease [Candidatus Nomurabacteria bacterium]|nr:ABC transporter permease [Candidatus Nomurabacteria bacterium]
MKNIKAILAITKADLQGTFKNLSSVFFGILFPLIFILVFGLLGNDGVKLEVGVMSGSDTNNPIYKALDSIENIELKTDSTDKDLHEELSKGNIDAVINISTSKELPNYTVDLQTSAANPDGGSIVKSIIESITQQINTSALEAQNIKKISQVKTDVVEGRKYRQIDFILPGQLGFALLSSGVFGTSFLFVSLRETLVIKRFFATPINRTTIVIGEALSKVLFALLQATVIILIGHFAFNFTLVHGFSTFLEMLFLSAFGLMIFLGFGFIVSSVAKDQNSVPPLANIFTLPQFLLAGTFFPIDLFPKWLQPLSRILPLTYLNEAMRKVAFEGVSILALKEEMLALLVAMVVVYFLAIRLFKWE